MNFGICPMDTVVPKPVLNALIFLGFLQKLLHLLFMHLGLSNFFEPDAPWSEPDSTSQQPKSKPFSAMLIKEKLPVVRFEELEVDHETPRYCVICLDEFYGQDEIQPLELCKHVFHRKCLDGWADHDQKTCPLCRSPLVVKSWRRALECLIWGAG